MFLTSRPLARTEEDAEVLRYDRLEGVLWIRPLWLAAWQCWLAVVSPKVSRVFVPDPDYIAALAREVRGSRESRPA
jgi:hypothetical protein